MFIASRSSSATTDCRSMCRNLAMRILPGLVLTMLATYLQLPEAIAADPPSAKIERLPRVNEVVRTSTGINLHFTYWPSKLGKEAAVVMLLHMKDSNRFVWQDGLAERLQDAGYAVVAVDLRGHGESKAAGAGVGPIAGGNANQPDDKKKAPVKSTNAGPKLRQADYQSMADDLNSLKKEFLFKEHQKMNLNMAKLAIVGPEMGATIASYYANLDWDLTPYADGPVGNRTPRGQDVKALVLISPETTFEGMKTLTPLHTLRNPAWKIAFLVCVGGNDPQDKGQAQKIYTALKPPAKRDRMYFKSYNTKLRGTDMLGKELELEDYMLAFFNRHLKNLEIPWQDRRPKYDREKN